MAYYINKNLKKYGHVETGWANRYQSDRFFNPNTMICPSVQYVDNMGRPSDYYSTITTTAGCNSALNRVNVEDFQRPSSFTFAGLSNTGIDGSYNCVDGNLIMEDIALDFDYSHGLIPDAQAKYSQMSRDEQWLGLGRKVRYYKQLSGMSD